MYPQLTPQIIPGNIYNSNMLHNQNNMIVQQQQFNPHNMSNIMLNNDSIIFNQIQHLSVSSNNTSFNHNSKVPPNKKRTNKVNISSQNNGLVESQKHLRQQMQPRSKLDAIQLDENSDDDSFEKDKRRIKSSTGKDIYFGKSGKRAESSNSVSDDQSSSEQDQEGMTKEEKAKYAERKKKVDEKKLARREKQKIRKNEMKRQMEEQKKLVQAQLKLQELQRTTYKEVSKTKQIKEVTK